MDIQEAMGGGRVKSRARAVPVSQERHSSAARRTGALSIGIGCGLCAGVLGPGSSCSSGVSNANVGDTLRWPPQHKWLLAQGAALIHTQAIQQPRHKIVACSRSHFQISSCFSARSLGFTCGGDRRPADNRLSAVVADLALHTIKSAASIFEHAHNGMWPDFAAALAAHLMVPPRVERFGSQNGDTVAGAASGG